MARLTKLHSDFRHPGLSYLNFKTLDMDRVLTAFLARLRWQGLPSRLARHSDLGVDDFVAALLELEEKGVGFRGFKQAPDVTRRWVETHLVDMVNRGRPTQAIAGLRPLHGSTYKYRNTKHSRPAGADEQLYEMLFGAPDRRGTAALGDLRKFFFSGLDAATGRSDPSGHIDVETQALLHLCDSSGAPDDRADTGRPRRAYPPFCPSHAALLADDVLRLMHHQRAIPRSVLVEYLKILFAFHLALHHLRLITALPQMTAGNGQHRCRLPSGPTTPETSGTDCAYRVGILVDVADRPRTPAAALAERSAAAWWQRIPAYVRAGYEVKKLEEFGEHLVKRRKLPSPQGGVFSVEDAIALGRRTDVRAERDAFFEQRLANVVDSAEPDELPDEVNQILELGLDSRAAYLDVLTAVKGEFHRKYLIDCLDSLLLKNRPGALVGQPRGHARRFVLDSRLIEVLLQIALLRPHGDRFATQPLRVDEILTILRVRYGLHVDRLPDGEGFAAPSIDDHAALRANSRAFTDRLREIGFYSDLSDAYLTQTIRPRYTV
jgi:hypothetical protein